MLPPQAPPAHVSHANQAAVDMLQRMGDTQQWLTDQQDALWDLPRTLAGRDAFLTGLDTFWETPVEHTAGEPASARRQALARRLGQAARDDAALRHNDGTLSEQATAMVARLPHQGGPLPDGLRTRELLVGTTPYAGALVVEDDRQPGLVLLFLADSGWQVFDSLDTLHREVEESIRQRLAERTELPGIAADTIEAQLDKYFLDSRLLTGEVFDILARRLIARHRERAVAAYDGALTQEDLHGPLQAAIDLHELLDTHAIVRHRDLALAAERDQERLARQPDKVRKHWRQAAQTYRNSWRQADALNVIPPMVTFAEAELTKALKKRGIDAPAHALYVAYARRTIANPIATAFQGFPSENLSLIELAFRNISSLKTDGLIVVRADGSPREDIAADVLRDVVRDLDLPNAYARHLDEALGDSPEGLLQRALATDLLRARMRFEAADARLSYLDPSEPRSFMDDRLERGFQWVQAVLDHPDPAQRGKVERHEIVVHQLTYKGSPLTGVFMIAARQRDAVARVVLYTPDAPDGIAFREFDDRADLTRRFLLDRRYETYLLERLPAEYAVVDDGGKRHFDTVKLNGGRSTHWVLGIEGCRECTQMTEHFQEREVTGSFLDAAYDTTLSLAKRNAYDVSRTRLQAQVDGWFDVFFGWNLPVNLAREIVTGTIKSIPNTANAAWRVYDHVKAGDSVDAFLAFTDGYVNALNVLPLVTQVPAAIGGQVRAMTTGNAFVSSRRALPAADTLFEKRFIAKGVTAPPGPAPASGVYTIGGDRFIRHADQFYQVRFDAGINGWRLTYQGVLDANFTGPAVERLANGRWHYRRVGLRGGMDPELELIYKATDMVMELPVGAALNPQLAQMSFERHHTIAATLLRRTTPGEANTIFTTMTRSVPDATLTTAQLRLWDEALAIASERSPSAARPSVSAGLGAATAPARSVQYTKLTDAQWPDHVYVYMSSSELASALANGRLYLKPKRLPFGKTGIAVTTLPPETPWRAVPRPGFISPRPLLSQQPHSLGSSASAWFRIDTRGLKSRHPHQTLSRVVGTDLFVMPRPNGSWLDLESSYILTRNPVAPGTSRQPLFGGSGTS